jgi:hypothetical protein
MTNQEQARYAKAFMARRKSRIVNLQSGHEDVMAQFTDPSYNSGTLEEANADSQAASVGTTRVDVVGDPAWTGSVPGAVADGDGSVAGAIDILQQHIASLGDSNLLDVWASTAAALKKTVSGDVVPKAKPNAEGQTREPLVVNSNADSQAAGSHGYIDSSELARQQVNQMELEASKLTVLKSRIVEITRL